MIIFHQFSWQQFLIAAAVLTLIWYALVGLLCYRREIAALFSGKAQVLRGGSPVGRSLRPVREPEELSDSLLGASREPEGVLTLAMDQFSFAGMGSVRGREEEAAGWERELDERAAQLALVPDLMEELKTLFYRLERDGGTRQDFEGLFLPLAARFEAVMMTPAYAAVNAYILENVPFELSLRELEALWEA